MSISVLNYTLETTQHNPRLAGFLQQIKYGN